MEEKGAALSLRSSARSTAVIFDRHPVWLQAIGTILERSGIQRAGIATSSDEMLGMIETLKPDLLIAEPSTGLSGASEVAPLRRARELRPELRIVVLSASDDPEDIAAAFDAGALAYVLKTSQPDDIATAIRQTFNSSIFFRGHAMLARASGGAAALTHSPGGDAGGLTRRELQILKLVAEGHTNAQLARMLWVTEQTVKFHLSNIYRKLDVANRTEASRWAQRQGLLSQTADRAVVA
jgi:DNA-binding NarL/FixJ family response regulator